MKKIILFFSLLVALSCEQENQDTDNVFNAIVLSEGVDCGASFLIQFNNEVENLPENNVDNIFYEINLPQEYKIANLQIQATFRAPTASEEMGCTTFGILYPQIMILSVE